MWTPWAWATGWGRSSNTTAVENARAATVACSQALVERLEIEQYVEELLARRARPAIPA